MEDNIFIVCEMMRYVWWNIFMVDNKLMMICKMNNFMTHDRMRDHFMMHWKMWDERWKMKKWKMKDEE